MKVTAQDYRRTQTKHRKAKKGHGWTKLERIEMDCIWVIFKNVGPPFLKFLSAYIKISFTQRENHSLLLCGLDFANELKTLALPIWRLELIIDKIKQKYLKLRDVASLSTSLSRPQLDEKIAFQLRTTNVNLQEFCLILGGFKGN